MPPGRKEQRSRVPRPSTMDRVMGEPERPRETVPGIERIRIKSRSKKRKRIKSRIKIRIP
jgi:hypothetical protein